MGFVFARNYPVYGCVEVCQCFLQARVSIGEKSEGCRAGILAGSATIRAALLAYCPMQIAVAHEAGQVLAEVRCPHALRQR